MLDLCIVSWGEVNYDVRIAGKFGASGSDLLDCHQCDKE